MYERTGTLQEMTAEDDVIAFTLMFVGTDGGSGPTAVGEY